MAKFERTLLVKGDHAVWVENAIDYHNLLASGFRVKRAASVESKPELAEKVEPAEKVESTAPANKVFGSKTKK